ncbi:MAG: hypothetical protein H6728_08820 [Myxococcales bacterium]|nr:hypothetical protein [Myxococcales bacterium]
MSVRDTIDDELMFSAVLFLLPSDDEDRAFLVQDRFLRDQNFWEPYLARLHLWARPFAVSKTEAPDGEPALILVVELCEADDILTQIGQEICQELGLPAFTVTHVGLDRMMRRELQKGERPW